MILRFLPLLIAMCVSACAPRGDYPSLAKRPFEKGETSPAPAPVLPTIPSDPALIARIEGAVKDAQASVSAFEAALPAAREAARKAAGAPSGSEAWINGQLGISRLEKNVIPARDALASLNGDETAVVVRGNAEDIARLQAGIAEIEAIANRQSEIVRELLGMLR